MRRHNESDTGGNGRIVQAAQQQQIESRED
jgi:hypothetical protein